MRSAAGSSSVTRGSWYRDGRGPRLLSWETVCTHIATASICGTEVAQPWLRSVDCACACKTSCFTLWEHTHEKGRRMAPADRCPGWVVVAGPGGRAVPYHIHTNSLIRSCLAPMLETVCRKNRLHFLFWITQWQTKKFRRKDCDTPRKHDNGMLQICPPRL